MYIHVHAIENIFSDENFLPLTVSYIDKWGDLITPKSSLAKADSASQFVQIWSGGKSSLQFECNGFL